MVPSQKRVTCKNTCISFSLVGVGIYAVVITSNSVAMERTPTKKTNSTPDLSTCVKDPGAGLVFIKRKHPDDYNLSLQFENLSRELVNLMNSWKLETERDIKEINNNIGSIIKSELTSLTTRTTEMQEELCSLRSDYSDVKSNISVVQVHQTALKTEVEDIKTSLEYQSGMQRDLGNQLELLKTSVNKSSALQVNMIDEQVTKLRIELTQLQQRERLRNLEIVGIPDIKNEILPNIIVSIAAHAGVTLTEEDIDHVNRVQPRQLVPGRSRVIVVKFKSRIHKDSILSGLRRTRGVTTRDIRIPGDLHRIYVNEHLTYDNKSLLKQTKEKGKLKLYQFIWVKNCQIFIRKNDVSPAMLIRNTEDLKKIV